VAEIPGSTDRQSAVRLLACIDAGGNPDHPNQWGPDVVAALHAQSRLHALDFWMRNPDYLANELLTEFEASGDRTLVHLAQRIFDDREPDLRRLTLSATCFSRNPFLMSWSSWRRPLRPMPTPFWPNS
jgi:hypothetical protein